MQRLISGTKKLAFVFVSSSVTKTLHGFFLCLVFIMFLIILLIWQTTVNHSMCCKLVKYMCDPGATSVWETRSPVPPSNLVVFLNAFNVSNGKFSVNVTFATKASKKCYFSYHMHHRGETRIWLVHIPASNPTITTQALKTLLSKLWWQSFGS